MPNGASSRNNSAVIQTVCVWRTYSTVMTILIGLQGSAWLPETYTLPPSLQLDSSRMGPWVAAACFSSCECTYTVCLIQLYACILERISAHPRKISAIGSKMYLALLILFPILTVLPTTVGLLASRCIKRRFCLLTVQWKDEVRGDQKDLASPLLLIAVLAIEQASTGRARYLWQCW
jgi:hypothetical protein